MGGGGGGGVGVSGEVSVLPRGVLEYFVSNIDRLKKEHFTRETP